MSLSLDRDSCGHLGVGWASGVHCCFYLIRTFVLIGVSPSAVGAIQLVFKPNPYPTQTGRCGVLPSEECRPKGGVCGVRDYSSPRAAAAKASICSARSFSSART